jgi:hypothetical protein
MYSNGVETGYYYSYSPSTSSTEGKYGWDISGSPDWAKVFYKSVNVYATKEQTQAIYKAGFYLDSPVITSLNGKTKK